MNNQTSKNLFPETGSVYFDPVFQKVRDRRKEKPKKQDNRYGYIERSIITPKSNVTASTALDLADNSQDVQFIQNEKKG